MSDQREDIENQVHYHKVNNTILTKNMYMCETVFFCLGLHTLVHDCESYKNFSPVLDLIQMISSTISLVYLNSLSHTLAQMRIVLCT